MKLISYLCVLMSTGVIASPLVEDSFQISIVQLVVTPEKYVGKMVEIKGYLKRGNGLILYPNHLSASMRDEPSGVTVFDRPEGPLIYNACDSKYVLVRGRFDTDEGVFYFVRDVEFVIETETLKSCWSAAH